MKPLVFTLSFLLISSLSRISILAAPLAIQHEVQEAGPEGNISLLERWRDTVGTATQVWAHGAASPNDIFHTDRSGPISSVYRSTLGTAASTACEPGAEGKCEVAIDGFGTVGEVHFDFESRLNNIKGRSSQVMISCLCVSKECGQAVLIRPVNVYPVNSDGSIDSSSKPEKSCIYEQVDGEFTDCHTELLRVTYRDRRHRPNYLHGEGAFNYSVTDPNYGDFWNATGQRGWERDCTETDVNDLSVFDSRDVKKDNIGFHVHYTNPAAPHCKSSDNGVRYLRENDDAGTQCANLYEYAAAAASHRATQQDEISIGNVQATYVYPKPELVSDTELALSCSGAALGLLFVWTVFRKQLTKRNATTWYTSYVVLIQCLSFFLEALPLHTALGTEISAKQWVSQFASVDGTVALAQGHNAPQGSAQGSVLILTAVLGEVRYRKTRVGLIVSLTLFFDVSVLVLIILTLIRKLTVRHFQKRGLLPKRTIRDPEFSNSLLSMSMFGKRQSSGEHTSTELCNDRTTPGSSELSRRVSGRIIGESCDGADESLTKHLSDAVSVDGLVDVLMGSGRDEISVAEQNHVEQLGEGSKAEEEVRGSSENNGRRTARRGGTTLQEDRMAPC